MVWAACMSLAASRWVIACRISAIRCGHSLEEEPSKLLQEIHVPVHPLQGRGHVEGAGWAPDPAGAGSADVGRGHQAARGLQRARGGGAAW